MKLPEEFKSKWIAALRSGEYKQCKHKLYDGIDSYCCLGVAGCLNGIPVDKMVNRSCKTDKIYSLVTPNPLDDSIIEELTDLNDRDKKSFLEIADYIEANL